MKKILTLLFAVMLSCASTAFAQSPNHSSTLTWTASTDAASNSSLFYNIYRSTGPCNADGSLPITAAKIGTTLALVNTYTDTNVSVVQSYCYTVRATLNGVESADSNAVIAVIPLGKATNLQVTTK